MHVTTLRFRLYMDPPAPIYITAVAYHGERPEAIVAMQRHDSVGSLCEKLQSRSPDSLWIWGDAWFPNKPIKYSQVWQRSIKCGGLAKWCKRLHSPELLSKLALHSSENPGCVDILFTLPCKHEDLL